MGACASVAKAMRGDAGKAPPPEQPPPEETTMAQMEEKATEMEVTAKEVPAGEMSEIMSEEPKEIQEPEATTAPPEAEAIVPIVEEKEPEAKA